MTHLEHAILQTVAYHALFDFPLTRQEIFRGLMSDRAYSLTQILDAIEDLIPQKLQSVSGFVVLPGQESSIEKRLARYRITEQKFRKALRFTRYARYFPFVRAVMVSNTVATSNAREASDIDFFILAKNHHVWTARLFLTGFAALLGQRPTPLERKDRLCLCFYQAVEPIDMASLQLPNDIHLPAIMTQCYPIFNQDEAYEQWWKSQQWLHRIFAHAQPLRPVPRRQVVATPFSRTVQWIAEQLTKKIETRARQWQEKHLPENLRQHMDQGGVVLSWSTIKLHENDRREQTTALWKQHLRAFE